MTATIIPLRRRPHLRLIDAAQEAVRRAAYEEEVRQGYHPQVLPIPPQKPRDAVTTDTGEEWI